MEVYECGTWVLIKVANVRGLITRILAHYDHILYQITYFDGSELKRAWMHENEFVAGEIEDNRKVGFK